MMTSFTSEEQLSRAGGDELWKKRDEKFGLDCKKKAEKRAYIQEPEIDPGMYRR